MTSDICEAGNSLSTAYYKSIIAEAHITTMNFAAATEHLNDAIEVLKLHVTDTDEAEVARVQGLLFWKQEETGNGIPNEAETQLRRAHDIARDARAVSWQLQTALTLARYLLAKNGTGETWQYSVPCDSVGVGHATGGLVLHCQNTARPGGVFCASFVNARGLGGVFVIGTVPALYPPLTLGLPVLCANGFLRVMPVVVTPVSGTIARLCVPLPNLPSLAGHSALLQGFAAQPGGCFLATDAVVVTIQR